MYCSVIEKLLVVKIVELEPAAVFVVTVTYPLVVGEISIPLEGEVIFLILLSLEVLVLTLKTEQYLSWSRNIINTLGYG
jgi:hypothetical protein